MGSEARNGPDELWHDEELQMVLGSAGVGVILVLAIQSVGDAVPPPRHIAPAKLQDWYAKKSAYQPWTPP